MKTGPKFKICRRLGPGVFEQCQTPRFTKVEGKGTQKRGRGGMGAKGDFGAQLLKKQQARFTYRVGEKQFSNYVKKAVAVPGASTQALYESLESRLDNVVFRMGLAHTRALARQLVSHGHVQVNGRRMNIPSYQVAVGDQISIRPGSQASPVFVALVERYKEYTPPQWIAFDIEKKEGMVKAKPQLVAGEQPLDLQSVVEFYSR